MNKHFLLHKIVPVVIFFLTACGTDKGNNSMPAIDSEPITISDTHIVFDRSVLWYESTPHKLRTAKVALVYDGDTLRTDSGEVIRFLGINAPEIAHPEKGDSLPEPFGDAARDWATKKLTGKTITLIIPDERPTDIYGRTLALIIYKDKIINFELIKESLAKTYFLDNRSLINEWAWYSIQEEIRQKHKGVWSIKS